MSKYMNYTLRQSYSNSLSRTRKDARFMTLTDLKKRYKTV